GVARPPAGATTHGQAACRGSRLLPGPPAKATDNQPARSSHQKVQSLVAWVAASRRNRPGAPAGVGSAYRVGTHGGAPFGDGTSPQGRRLRAQCQQELPPKGQRCPSAHWGSNTSCKGGRL
ncbi:hypothetical protein BHE74_00042611, partial [Ensete ventricosum]